MGAIDTSNHSLTQKMLPVTQDNLPLLQSLQLGELMSQPYSTNNDKQVILKFAGLMFKHVESLNEV